MISEKDDVIVKVENVGKEYILGAVTGNTLKEALKGKHVICIEADGPFKYDWFMLM